MLVHMESTVYSVGTHGKYCVLCWYTWKVLCVLLVHMESTVCSVGTHGKYCVFLSDLNETSNFLTDL